MLSARATTLTIMTLGVAIKMQHSTLTTISIMTISITKLNTIMLSAAFAIAMLIVAMSSSGQDNLKSYNFTNVT